MKIANLDEATELLNRYIPRPLDVRAVYNLDTIRALAAFVGNPQDKVRVLHVAGTSGKTSTSYYMAALLQAAGKKVGLTVSPHITTVNERVQIDLVPMPEAEFCRELGVFMDEVEKSGLKPTYFEILMAFAYWEFARQKVDYAVIEVGLGGLLDGSNIVTRADKICVITDIGFDHMHILGSTLPEIATQKAGIIHAGNEVFMHEQTTEAVDVVRAACEKEGATLHLLPDATEVSTPFLPLYQQRNLHLAVEAVRFALQRAGQQLAEAEIAAAATVHIPGRMETFHVDGKTIVLDGAHNPQKLQAMAESVRATYSDEPIAALLGFVGSKEVSLAENAEIVTSLAPNLIVTAFGSAQENGQPSIDPETVAAACKQVGAESVQTETDHQAALQKLLARPEKILLVTGSLYLISYLRPLVLGLAASR